MIRPGDSAPLVFQALDGNGDPVTGLTTITAKVFNPANGQVWDWSVGAFSATPASPTTTLTEISAANMPGYYLATWPGTDAEGDYIAEITPPAGMTADDRRTARDLIVRDFPTAAAVAALQADIDDIQARLPATLIGGRIDASVGAVATDAITAAGIAADAVAAIQSGLATAAAVAALPAAVWATATPVAGWVYSGAIELLVTWILGRYEVTAANDGTATLYRLSDSTEWITWSLRDAGNGAIKVPNGNPALRGAAAVSP